jgi:hypothetical protein
MADSFAWNKTIQELQKKQEELERLKDPVYVKEKMLEEAEHLKNDKYKDFNITGCNRYTAERLKYYAGLL